MWFFKRRFRNPHLSKKEQYKALRKIRDLSKQINRIVHNNKLSDDEVEELAYINRRLIRIEYCIIYNTPLSEEELKTLRVIFKRKFFIPTREELEE